MGATTSAIQDTVLLSPVSQRVFFLPSLFSVGTGVSDSTDELPRITGPVVLFQTGKLLPAISPLLSVLGKRGSVTRLTLVQPGAQMQETLTSSVLASGYFEQRNMTFRRAIRRLCPEKAACGEANLI